MNARAAALLVVAAIATPVSAQTLADAARLAEEQRAAAGGTSRTYSNATLGGASGYASLLGDNFLLSDYFDAYAAARTRLAAYRLSHLDLDMWLNERVVKAKDRFDLESVYGQDKSVLQALGRMTPRDYFKTDLAFSRALEDVRLAPADREANLPRARAANAQYVATHDLLSWSSSTLKTEQDVETRRESYIRRYPRR